MDKLVLVAQWSVKDNWYGTHHRVIVSNTNDLGFKNKTQASRYKSKLIKYVKSKHNLKTKDLWISIGDILSYKEYTYVAMGPSLYFYTSYITIDKLDGLEFEK